jgi:putative transposase
MVERGYKYRFYPTPVQEQILLRTFGCVRIVYNHFLALRQESYIKDGKKISYHETSALLTGLKKTEEKAWLNEVSCVPLQQSLRHLQVAYTNFFRGTAKYPNFKKKFDAQSAEYTRSAFNFSGGKLTLAKMDSPLDIRWSRRFKGVPSTITVSRDASGRYFLSFLVKESIKPLKRLKTKVGIDLGIKDFAVLSTGEKFANPRILKRYANKLKRAQQSLSRKKKGSNNRIKAKLQVAKIHAKITDIRKDFSHKLSTKIVRENQVICVEDLAVKNMVKNRKLAKAISDVGWGEFTRQLEYKSKWYGREFVRINRFFPTSKRCSGCGYTAESLPLDIRKWECPSCNANHDRDVNAAVNILAVGTTVLACGENVNLVSSGISCSL